MIKDKIEFEYGTINKFIDKKLIDCKGQLPFTRQHLYDLINHRVPNPGIRTLNQLANLVDVPLTDVINEYIAD